MSNYESDGEEISDALHYLAHSITPNCAPGEDANGGTVASLTEAVMGVTGGLCRIADAIESLASAVGEVARRV